MDTDLEISIAHMKIRKWYQTHLKQYKEELPKEELKIAKAALDEVMRLADHYHRIKDKRILEVATKTNWFVLPWKVLLWYSVMGKKQGS